MRGLLRATAAFFVAVPGGGATAWAQDPQMTNTFPVTISVTPRLWYVADNENSFSRNLQTVPFPQSNTVAFIQTSSKLLSYPLYGLTVEAAPKTWSQVSFLLTGFYGSGTESSTSSLTSTFPTFGPSEFVFGSQTRDFSRFDIEGLGRYRSSANVNFVSGFRVISYSNKYTTIFPEPFPFTATLNSTLNYYLLEGGVSFSAPIGDDDRQSLFAGATVGLGAFNLTTDTPNAGLTVGGPSGSGFAATIDVNVGYQYAIATAVALNIRYRAVAFGRSASQGSFAQNINVLHGPEIGVTMRF